MQKLSKCVVATTSLLQTYCFLQRDCCLAPLPCCLGQSISCNCASSRFYPGQKSQAAKLIFSCSFEFLRLAARELRSMAAQFTISPLHPTITLLVVLIGHRHVSAFSPQILPGTGLLSTRSRTGVSSVEVVVFEHTEHGTGGLVLNRPAPILLRDIASPRFKDFGGNSLMLGCGLEGDTSEEKTSNVALGDMSPWFW